MRNSAFRMPGKRVLTAAVLLAFAGPVSATQFTGWQRVRADPRAAYVATMTATERHAFARDHGLESLLPGLDATTRTVTNCNDSGSGSLRATIVASASGDIVDASGLVCGTISLTTGAIDIGVDNLTIKGPGPNALKVGNGSKYYHRVFNHTGTGTLTIAGMTVTRGTIRTGGADPGSTGGCINSAGNVVLGNNHDSANRAKGVVVSDCAAISTQAGMTAMGGGVYARYGVSMYASVISGCRASAQGTAHYADGGGVAVLYGSFTAKYSEIRDNATAGPAGRGGGVYARFASSTAIENATIAGNASSGDAGGAIVGAGWGKGTSGAVQIRNSTISGNTSSMSTAGLMVYGSSPDAPVSIASTTIADNHRAGSGFDRGVGARVRVQSLELQSTIISGNTDDDQPSDLDVGTYGTAVTGGNNLLGNFYGPVPTTGLITSNTPGVAPLANNGGIARTRTQALLPGSPAIDMGNNSQNLPADQRGFGFPRTMGVAPDIGAFERDPDVIFQNGFE